MIILGIGGVLHDAAAAILKDGELVAAVEEAKIARTRREGGLPHAAVQACLALAEAAPAEIDYVAVARPVGANTHLELRARFPSARIVVVDHHAAHAASAYFASPFESATVLTLDRAGDLRCGARWRASGNSLTLEREAYAPDSLADLYSRVAELAGFTAGAEEHKLQWMSAAGDGRLRDVFGEMMPALPGRWPHIDRSFLDPGRLTHGGFSAKFFTRLGLDDGAAIPESLGPSLAAGLQKAVEAAIIDMAGEGDNLCLAGGLGYNALLVAALERSGRFRNVFVQPSAGNAGTAFGAVFHVWHTVLGEARRAGIGNFCLGPGYSAEQIKQVLENCKLRFRYLRTTGEIVDTAVAILGERQIVAWMHGRMEFGPRALGNRSILASPLDPYSTENLNRFIKHRESFRKFAASVPVEVSAEYFDAGSNARFLSTAGKVRPAHRERFSAAILGGDWIRVHTVSQQDNPMYWNLLHAAGRATGLPVLYNTSFNLFGDPLVCTPRDAVRSFYSSGIDAMVVGNFLLQK
ncbi:MAG: carbamoyltransferase C-terminal domain-containing protein [Bryobacteraceae bacterium]